MQNPFMIGFGIKPTEYIPLLEQRREVENAFNESNSKKRAYVISGVRGSGKTVMMSEISRRLGDDWIIIEISPQSDMLNSLASQLYADRSMHKLFVRARIDLSFLNIGVHIDGASMPAYDNQTAITMMLEEIEKRHKKVLVKIDEVANTQEMRHFASVFQILISRELPIFLLMAGIPDNVRGLSEGKQSTFLMRTPRIEMGPLNISSIKRSYIRSLHVPEETALELAHLTRGYAFGYQALGSICWNREIDTHSDSFQEILDEYDQTLQDYSYSKIWEELSATDRKVLRAIASIGDSCKVGNARELLNMQPAEFNIYRKRLEKKGLLDTSTYGVVSFTLPRFEEFARDQIR